MTASGTARVTLPADDRILIARELDVPRHLVYRAWTTPELVRRWWNAKRGVVTTCEIDLRVGGAWRYVMVTDGGLEVAFHGRFLELAPDERIVSTEVFEAAPPEAETMNTVSFADEDGRTALTILVECPSADIRDTIIDSGMEAGLQDALDLLEGVASSLD